MPLNTTNQELRLAAARDLAEKLKLEARQITDLRELFRNMSEDMEAFVAETGQTPSATVYADDLRGLLARQGRRVGRAFSGRVTDFLEEEADQGEEEAVIAALAAIAAITGLTVLELVSRMRNNTRRRNQEFIADQVARDTRFISGTNQREMDASVAAARTSIIDDGRVPTNTEVARRSSNDFKNRGFNRAPTIAATFTQKIAEGVKGIEREEFFNTRNGFPTVIANVPQAEEQEKWVTVGDELVRQSHIAADLQESENGGFIVQGEFLRFPGDPQGSPSNVINCRCSAVIVIDDQG